MEVQPAKINVTIAVGILFILLIGCQTVSEKKIMNSINTPTGVYNIRDEVIYNLCVYRSVDMQFLNSTGIPIDHAEMIEASELSVLTHKERSFFQANREDSLSVLAIEGNIFKPNWKSILNIDEYPNLKNNFLIDFPDTIYRKKIDEIICILF